MKETDMGPQFFQTRMGQRYYEGTTPKIAAELARLADNVAALNETLGRVLDATRKRCIKCGELIVVPQLQGHERCAPCGDGP